MVVCPLGNNCREVPRWLRIAHVGGWSCRVAVHRRAPIPRVDLVDLFCDKATMLGPVYAEPDGAATP